MKKRIGILLLVFCFFCSLSLSVNGAYLRETIEEKTLMTGVTYCHFLELSDGGWQDIHVVRVDLKTPGVALKILKSEKGESYLENVLKLAEKNDAIAALNADFFAAKRGESGRGSAVGVEIRDGELKSSASVSESMNTLFSDANGNEFSIDAFLFDITLKTKKGLTDKIKLINKYDDLTGIVMYTDEWGEYSVGSVGGSIEVSVDKNGIVLEKVTESAPLLIPEDGYVLSAHMSYNTFLLDNVEVGDKLEVDVKSTPDFTKIKHAVGGGAVILKDGEVPASFSHTVSGRHPRSAVGIDETGNILTLVALDGRRTGADGLTQTELGHLMKELGCASALNFDGGGSTQMAVQNMGETKIVNEVSGGYLRPVTNALGVVSTLPETASLKKIMLLSSDNVFLGTSTELTPIGIDKYDREVKWDWNAPTYTVNNKNGTVKNGAFYASKSGKTTITVRYKNFTAKREITVLNLPREINFDKEKVSLSNGDIYIPNLTGKDENGNMAKINLSDAEVTVSGDAVSVKGNEIQALKSGASFLTAKVGDVTANLLVLVDGAAEISVPENIVIPDSQNVSRVPISKDALTFSVFGNTRLATTIFDQFVMNTALSKMKNTSDFTCFLGANVHTNMIEKMMPDYVTAKKYNCFLKGENTFITIPNVSSKIYNGDASVWTNFERDAKSSKQNLFVFLDRNFISEIEGEILSFRRIVTDAAQNGKNVYVFGGGFKNQNTIEDGVRYINTAGVFPSVALDGTHPDYIQYVLVTVDGEDVTFTFNQILGE